MGMVLFEDFPKLLSLFVWRKRKKKYIYILKKWEMVRRDELG